MYEIIMFLRSQAAIIYDQAKAKRLSEDDIINMIKPITDRLNQVIESESHNLESSAQAIEMFKANARARRTMAEEMIEKAKLEESYADLIEQAVARRIKESGHETKVEKDRIATITQIGNKGSVQIR